MSMDEKVTKDLVATLEDGKEGFAKGAEKIESSDSPDVAATFRDLSAQRGRFSAELRQLAESYGDAIDAEGTMAGALHRGWMTLKDALTGSDPSGVLDAAEQGEDHAVKEYENALKADISPRLRTVVERQFGDVRAAHDQVRALREHARRTPG